jgi:perosamine synthetase
MVELRENGVDVAEYVPCIHLLSYMRERYGFREGLYPVAEEISSRTLALPFFPHIEPDDQAYVVETLRRALER